MPALPSFLQLVLAASTGPADALVTVSGGADTGGHQYSWTVTNHGTQPIVRLEFPHYRAGLFLVPDGWRTDETTHLVKVGAKDRPGVCVAAAPSAAAGIAPAQSAPIRMQIAATGARRGRGTVQVGFADGTVASVSGVELPQREAISERFASLIGLGVIFLAIVAVRIARRKRTA